MTKQLGVASDHAGLELKRALVTELEKRGVVVREFGTTTSDSCDYPDFAHAVGRAIEGGEIERDLGVRDRRGDGYRGKSALCGPRGGLQRAFECADVSPA